MIGSLPEMKKTRELIEQFIYRRNGLTQSTRLSLAPFPPLPSVNACTKHGCGRISMRAARFTYYAFDTTRCVRASDERDSEEHGSYSNNTAAATAATAVSVRSKGNCS